MLLIVSMCKERAGNCPTKIWYLYLCNSQLHVLIWGRGMIGVDFLCMDQSFSICKSRDFGMWGILRCIMSGCQSTQLVIIHIGIHILIVPILEMEFHLVRLALTLTCNFSPPVSSRYIWVTSEYWSSVSSSVNLLNLFGKRKNFHSRRRNVDCANL